MLTVRRCWISHQASVKLRRVELRFEITLWDFDALVLFRVSLLQQSLRHNGKPDGISLSKPGVLCQNSMFERSPDAMLLSQL